MSTEKLANANTILDRVKSAYKLGTDAELARFLDVTTGTVSTWRKRNAMKIGDILEFVSELNMNWLLFGEGVTWRKDVQRIYEYASNLKSVSDPEKQYQVKGDSSSFAAQVIEHLENTDLTRESKIRIVHSLIRIIQSDIENSKTQS